MEGRGEGGEARRGGYNTIYLFWLLGLGCC